MTRRRMSHRFVRRTNGGFTLIELLVVIAVFAILAAIIYPVYKSASERSRRTTCISNLRQIAQAIRTYAADARGLLPPGPVRLDPPPPGAPAHARSGSAAYQRLGLGALVPDPLGESVICCQKAVENPPVALDQTATQAEIDNEKDLRMMFWQQITVPGDPVPKWVKASYHYRPDFYTAGDGIGHPGRLSVDPNDPAVMASLPDKLPPGTDPQTFVNDVLLRWDRPIVFDYNHRKEGRSGILYVNLEAVASYQPGSTVIIQSPWPP